MDRELCVSLLDMVMSYSRVSDLVSPTVADHQLRTAYIASHISGEVDLPLEKRNELLFAAALHDCGAFSLKERLTCLRFDFEPGEHDRHCEVGYKILRKFRLFSPLATLVRYHHVPWNGGKGLELKGEEVPLGSHILHLADRVDVLTDRNQPILRQGRSICDTIEEQSGKKFAPKLVEAFNSLAAKESFWLGIAGKSGSSLVAPREGLAASELRLDDLFGLAQLFGQLVDFRNRFTATHTNTVTAVADTLARHIGFSEDECKQMRFAGLLHDVGKLAVPAEVLDKPAKLTEDDWDLIRSHPYYTHDFLEPIRGLETIKTWASLHHERLDGNGYPFHRKADGLPLGSRIVAVAEVLTALTEDRPHRKGMSSKLALQVMQQMVDSSALDPHIVSLVKLNCEEFDCIRASAGAAEFADYQEIAKETE